MDVHLNTLYIVSRGASVRRDHLTLTVWVERQCRLAVPIHQLEGVAVFGNAHVTPGALQLCAERGVAVSFLTESGRLLSRVDAPGSGNVLLRRTQFRWADSPDRCAAIARAAVAGKVQNARNLLLRAARESERSDDQSPLQTAARHLAEVLPTLADLTDVDVVRGHEGDAARVYFEAFSSMVRQNRDSFQMIGRSRRPPLDRINSLLSFVYAPVTERLRLGHGGGRARSQRRFSACGPSRSAGPGSGPDGRVSPLACRPLGVGVDQSPAGETG